MAKATTKSAKPNEFLWGLVRTGYFPRELPPIFTTRHFAHFCKTNYPFLAAQKITLLKLSTHYAAFSAPRVKNGRRNFALVHPLGQIAMSLAITEHRKEIKKLIQRSGTSLYSTDEALDHRRAFRGLQFSRWDRLRSEMQSEFPFILSADISRFFYTVYTHSIPWAVIGKEQAKEWHQTNKAKLNSHWSSDFDRALQCCQSRETFGIPVGPDTSRIVAEILMAGVENDPELKKWLKNRSAVRMVDDFAIGFEREESAAQALAALRTTLSKFNLQLNDEKTGVIPSKISLKEKWEIENERLAISENNERSQATSISRLLDLTLHHCVDSKIDNPAVLTCQRIAKLKNVEKNFPLILNTLFRLAREYPRCISHVAGFLINNRRFCRKSEHKSRIAKWTQATLATHSLHGHDFEVAWAIVVCGTLRIRIRKSDLDIGNNVPSPAILALLGLVNERKLLTFSLSSLPWRAALKKAGLHSHYWLPFYEAVRRKWTKDNKLTRAVAGDPVMSRMLAKKVTFLEDRVFDASRISVNKRVFVSQKKPPERKNQKQVKPKEREAADQTSTSVSLVEIDYA